MMNGDYQGLAGLMKLKGRMGDTQLVHMSPMEVKTLDAMAPGGLTRNPSTGLPEAFKLKDILPALGAVAGGLFLAPLIGGGAVAAGLGTGLGSAGGTALAGGNKEEILQSGLFSGITAGLMAPGAEAAIGSSAGNKTLAEQLGKEGAKAAGLSGVPEQVLASPASQFTKSQLAQFGAGTATPQALAQKTGLEVLKQGGIKELGRAGLEQVGGKGLLASGAIGLATSPGLYDVPANPEVEMFPEVAAIENISTGVSKEDIDRYIRQGGSVPRYFDYNIRYAADGDAIGKMTNGGAVPFSSAGEGDGMSDNIKYGVVNDPNIDTAMLSPDEHIITANEVAALGNGSSDAGHKKLEEFRAALREKAYGRRKQPNQINATKMLNNLA